MFSTFEFFEPGVAAVAVASAAVCGHIRTKRKKENERERERKKGRKRERNEKGSIYFSKRDLRKREVRRRERKRRRKRGTREGREDIGGHGWMDPGGWTYGVSTSGGRGDDRE